MIGALRAEARTVLTLRPYLVAAMVAVVVAVGCALLVRSAYEQAGAPVLTMSLGLAQAGPVAVAAVLAAHEYRGGQHATSLRAVPRRGVLLVARWVAWAVAGAVVAALGVVGAALTAGIPAADLGPWWAAVVWVAGVSWAAAAVADATRSALAGAVTVLGVVWVVPALARTAWPDAGRWLPDSAGSHLLAGEWPGEFPWAAVAWLAACALASALAARREA